MQKGFAVLSILVILLITAAVGAGVYLISHPQILRSRASEVPCTGSLYVQLSVDKQTWSDSITIPTTATKYYLRSSEASDHTKFCSTAFDAADKNGKLIQSPWGSFKSDNTGLARIDIKDFPAGVYEAEFRPYQKDVPWSNMVTVNISKVAPRGSTQSIGSEALDLTDYYVYKPGYVWVYKNQNNLTGTSTATTRLQIEQTESWCGHQLLAWRFTKDSPDAYWSPTWTVNGAPGSSGNLKEHSSNLRWMLNDPNYHDPLVPNQFNDYIWVYGFRSYPLFDQNPMRDIDSANWNKVDHTLISLGRVPSYNLAPKSLTQSSYLDYAKGEIYTVASAYSSNNPNCSSTLVASEDLKNLFQSNFHSRDGSSWKIRIDKDHVSINNQHFKYDGDAVRIDYYEGPKEQETSPLLRESWYFVKGIGLVEIKEKTFHNYANNGSKNCIDDSDCLNDTIMQPFSDVTLDEYFQNPTFKASVSSKSSSSCGNFSDSVTTNMNDGYCLKVEDTSSLPYESPVNFTGYLEVRGVDESGNPTGSPVKYAWVDNGLYLPSADVLKSLQTGIYKFEFRVWVPNDPFPGETRVGSNDLTWSNPVTITLQ